MRASSSLLSIFLLALIILPYFSSSSLIKFAPIEFIAVHNAMRAAVRVPPMRWNKTIAAYAQSYANTRAADCRMEHSEGPYGENIASGFPFLTPKAAVDLWLEEKSHFNPASNACVNDQNQCLHYTQMVWRNSVQLGCGCAKCSSGGVFVTCNYYPPGNVIGQRPY